MNFSYSFLLLLIGSVLFGQTKFTEQKKHIEEKMQNSDYKSVIEMINSIRHQLTDTEKNDLDVIKLDALVNLELHDEAFLLSQELLSKKTLTPEQKVNTHIQRELIFEIHNKPKKCKEELDKAEEIFNKYPEIKPKNYTNFLIRKSSYFRVNNYREIAFKIAKEAEKYAYQVGDKKYISVIELIIGFGYRDKDPKKMLFHLEKALYEYQKIKNYNGVLAVYNNIGNYYLKEKEYSKAKIYIDSGTAISSKSVIDYLKSEHFMLKSKIFENLKMPDSALHYYKIYAEWTQKAITEGKDIKISELNNQFLLETEKLQKKQLEANIKAEKNRNLTLTMFTIILGVLLVTLAILYWILKKRNAKIERQRQNIAEQNKALAKNLDQKQFLVKELNHRVKNNLSVILSLIDFQKDETENESDKNKFDRLHQRINTILLAHELYSYNINQNDTSRIEMKDYTNKIFEAHKASFDQELQYTNNTENHLMQVDKALPIGLMLNELITNSLKHAKTDNEILKLFFKIKKIDKKIEIEYYDNGTEFKKVNKNSLGIFIIEGMIKQLGGSYERIKSHYKISFPYEKNT